MAEKKKTNKIVTKIRKRDGRIVPFEQEKIATAIFKAAQAVGGRNRKRARELAAKVTALLNEKFDGYTIPTVEQIQDLVEKVLIEEGHAKTAKAYILYRDQHARLRDLRKFIDSDELIDNYLSQLDWRVKENSNMTFSLQGLNNHVASAVSSHYWLHKIYPPEVREAHLNRDFHLHDLQLLSAYCTGWDLKDLLLRGFGGVGGKIESKPPKHLRTALGQVVNFFYTVQGEIAGAVAFSDFDTYFAPFIRYDGLTYKEVKQCLQEFLFNMNVPTRVGFQTPFTNITLDLTVPVNIKDEPVIVGGKFQKELYGDFQKEMDLFNRAFGEVMLEGDAKGRVFSFPIPTINITRDFQWGKREWRPLWEMTAKYGVSYFANFVNSDMKPEEARSMCLSPSEEVIIRNAHHIKRLSIGELVKHYHNKFDQEGWSGVKKRIEILSLNPQNLKTEWAKVKRFLRVWDKKLVTITSEDGRFMKVSSCHLVPVLTPQGIINKLARDVRKRDYLLVLRRGDKSLSRQYQKVASDLTLDENLAKILGYFTADGNFLFESRKNMRHYGEPQGLQFTFDSQKKKNIATLKKLIKLVFSSKVKEKKDPRYNTYYLYIYNTEIARILYQAGFRKYGRLPELLFNSPPKIIRAFLDFYFWGDGYAKRAEIHLNDLDLSRDLVLLYSLIGIPVTYHLRKESQVIYLQHKRGKLRCDGLVNNPLISERIPGFLAFSTYRVPGLDKKRTVGYDTLDKYQAHTPASIALRNSDIYIARVKKVANRTLPKKQPFFDVELVKNHFFVHSLGLVTHNCCRLRLDNRELRKRGGGLFGANPLTGAIGVVTINMPRLGYQASNKEDFFRRLEKVMELARKSLQIKRETLEKFTAEGLYPYCRHYLNKIKEGFGEYWRNHFNTIGLLGMNEACLNLLHTSIATERGHDFAKKVLLFMREKLMDYQNGENQLYNLEATPGEGTSYNFAKHDKEKYPKIIVANEKAYQRGAKPYYTNSTHLPVSFTDDMFEALDRQDDLQVLYSGGTVLHGFIGEKMPNITAVKKLVKTICYKHHLPYFTITPTFSICPKHGYIAGEHEYCPKCDEEIGYRGK